MRRIVCREFGPPEHLRLEVVPDPKPGPGEVLVKVHVAGVSFVDGLAPQTYPLERIAEALNALAKRQITGKLALLP